MQDMHGSPALHHPDPEGDKSGKAPSKKSRLDFRGRVGLKCVLGLQVEAKRILSFVVEAWAMETASLRWAHGVLALQQGMPSMQSFPAKWNKCKMLTAPKGLPGRSPTPVLTGPCAA